MSRVRFVPDFGGYRAVLNSPGVQSLASSRAATVAASAAGNGDKHGLYQTFTWTAKAGHTAHGVRTANYNACHDQHYHKSLSSSL